MLGLLPIIFLMLASLSLKFALVPQTFVQARFGSIELDRWIAVSVVLFVLVALATFIFSCVMKRPNDFLQAFAKTSTFLLIGLIGFGLTLVPLISWLVTAYNDPPADDTSTLLHVVRWLVIGQASVLPAMLYFLFYRQKVITLRTGFLRDTVRLNPNIYTIDDAEAQYGPRADDVYGALNSPQSVLGTHLPIIISTLLIAIGWTISLPISATPISATDAASAALAIFLPVKHPIVFGFLGAYFFSLNMIFRRYVRWILAPKPIIISPYA